MHPADLIRKAAAHLNEVGLKKGSFTYKDRKQIDKDKSPVCGVGALKWAATGHPCYQVRPGQFHYNEYLLAWNYMNQAAAEEDYSIPLDSDSFMVYNDDEDTTKTDVLSVMYKAAQLAEEHS